MPKKKNRCGFDYWKSALLALPYYGPGFLRHMFTIWRISRKHRDDASFLAAMTRSGYKVSGKSFTDADGRRW